MIKNVIREDCFYTNTYPGNLEIIQKHINHIIEFDKGRVKTNRGGYQSNDITFGFNDLIKFSFDSLKTIGHHVVLNNFWLNINDGYSYNDSHIHSNAGWSAVYYHKTCCDKATLEFHHLVPTLIDYDCRYVPIEKTMVFFKSNLPHAVNACNCQNHKRISIAFNFIENN